MEFILETSHLLLRKLNQEDSIHFFNLNNDPEVIRYTGDVCFLSLEEAQEFMRNYDPYTTTGMGRYAVISKIDDQFLGWCGLKLHPKQGVVDLGFRFYKNQ